jgi:hypothetical protein
VSAVQVGAVGAIGLALYAGHHVGDYWVQADDWAKHKGDAGRVGALACLLHVLSYVTTQCVCLFLLRLATGIHLSWPGVLVGMAVSGVTHYFADRREHGIMFRLARLIPGKAAFLGLGAPRPMRTAAVEMNARKALTVPLDNPTLGTGAWALDQAWHVFWGVFVAALLMAGLS